MANATNPAAAQAATEERKVLEVTRPAAGESKVYGEDYAQGSDVRMRFDLKDTTQLDAVAEGDNLVINFKDGAKVELQDFYKKFSKEQQLIGEDGKEELTAFLEALVDKPIETALGPSATAALNSSSFREYTDLDLLDGINHLRELDWGMQTAVEYNEERETHGVDDDGGYEGGVAGTLPQITVTIELDNPLIGKGKYADNVINMKEADDPATPVQLTGKVGGDAKAGDTVVIKLPNGDDVKTTVKDDLTYEAEATVGQLKGDGKLETTITITDDYGNKASATDDATWSEKSIALGSAARVVDESATVHAEGTPAGESVGSAAGTIAIVLDGAGKLTIGDQVFEIPATGKYAATKGIGIDSGKLEVTVTRGEDGGNPSISYTYTIPDGGVKHDQGANNESIDLPEVKMALTDSYGNGVGGSINIQVHDDVPSVSVSQARTDTKAVFDLDPGADGVPEGNITMTVDGNDVPRGDIKVTENEDGSKTIEYRADIPLTSKTDFGTKGDVHTVKVQVQDADGDDGDAKTPLVGTGLQQGSFDGDAITGGEGHDVIIGDVGRVKNLTFLVDRANGDKPGEKTVAEQELDLIQEQINQIAKELTDTSSNITYNVSLVSFATVANIHDFGDWDGDGSADTWISFSSTDSPEALQSKLETLNGIIEEIRQDVQNKDFVFNTDHGDKELGTSEAAVMACVASSSNLKAGLDAVNEVIKGCPEVYASSGAQVILLSKCLPDVYSQESQDEIIGSMVSLYESARAKYEAMPAYANDPVKLNTAAQDEVMRTFVQRNGYTYAATRLAIQEYAENGDTGGLKVFFASTDPATMLQYYVSGTPVSRWGYEPLSSEELEILKEIIKDPNNCTSDTTAVKLGAINYVAGHIAKLYPSVQELMDSSNPPVSFTVGVLNNTDKKNSDGRWLYVHRSRESHGRKSCWRG